MLLINQLFLRMASTIYSDINIIRIAARCNYQIFCCYLADAIIMNNTSLHHPILKSRHDFIKSCQDFNKSHHDFIESCQDSGIAK